MRVLHIHSGNLYGGVETLLITLARHRDLCPQMESHFALCFRGRLTEELEAAGAPVHILGEVRVRNPLSLRRAKRALRVLLAEGRFDLAICHSAWSQAIFGGVVRKAGLPLVFWLHDAIDGRHWLERWASKTPPDLAICNSKFTAGLLPKIFPQVPAKVIYCPVSRPQLLCSAAERDRVRAEVNTPREATVIVQVSRMEKWKGHEIHLEALAQLRTIPQWTCWFVGGAQRPAEQRYLESLKNEVGRLGLLDRVRFFGQRPDVARLLAAADIYCQPNLGPEPFGLTLVEALHAQIPIVATDVGGPKEIVDETCGILVPLHDAEATAAALRQLVENDDLRLRLGKAGPARAQALCGVSSQMPLLEHTLTQGLSNYLGPSSSVIGRRKLEPVPEQPGLKAVDQG